MDECIKANEHGKLNVLSREYIFDFFRCLVLVQDMGYAA